MFYTICIDVYGLNGFMPILATLILRLLSLNLWVVLLEIKYKMDEIMRNLENNSLCQSIIRLCQNTAHQIGMHLDSFSLSIKNSSLSEVTEILSPPLRGLNKIKLNPPPFKGKVSNKLNPSLTGADMYSLCQSIRG